MFTRMSANAPPVLPDEDALNLKCCLCNCYLSIGPVTTSTDGTKYQCGRCDFYNPGTTVRNFSYEKLGKFMAFPCIYKDCQNKIPWDQVQQHELTCPYRTIRCPIPDCDNDILCNEVIKHFNEYHRFAVISNVAAMFHKINTPFSTYMGMLVHEEIPFFCFICNDGKTFKISVYSISNHTYQRYEVDLYTLTFYRKKISLSGEKIIPYNDRKHCVRCYLGHCKLKLHKNSINSTNEYEMTTNVDITAIRSILKSETICCKISIEHAGFLKIIENIDIIRKVTECPICKEYMFGSIYSCSTGHSICHKCQKKVFKCPTCSAKFDDSRNYALEELSENIIMPCQYTKCNFIGTLEELYNHEDTCKSIKNPDANKPFKARISM